MKNRNPYRTGLSVACLLCVGAVILSLSDYAGSAAIRNAGRQAVLP